MRPSSISRFTRKPRFLLSGVAVGMGIGALLIFVWLTTPPPPPGAHLTLIPAQSTNAVPDDLRMKYTPRHRREFHLVSDRDVSIYVKRTAMETSRNAGWKAASEDYRGEIWRLKAGVAREVVMEEPPSEDWRAVIYFGTEMRGIALLKVQLREAWLLRSFRNWSGKPWGGGRFSGDHTLVCEGMAE